MGIIKKMYKGEQEYEAKNVSGVWKRGNPIESTKSDVIARIAIVSKNEDNGKNGLFKTIVSRIRSK